MTWASWRTAAVLGFSLLGIGTAARAQTVSIAGLFTTGVTNSNVLLGDNAADAHYVVNGPGATYDGNSRTVTASALAGGWVANTSSARWITTPLSGTNGTSPNRPNGTYDYTLTFTMPTGAQLNTVWISGTGAVDDTATILVNGAVVTGQTLNTWSSTNSFSLNSSNATFTSTTNTITFRVNNSGGGATGLLITSLSGTAVVPEVGAFLPIAGALALVAAVRVRQYRIGLA
jgi:hypothetical protein